MFVAQAKESNFSGLCYKKSQIEEQMCQFIVCLLKQGFIVKRCLPLTVSNFLLEYESILSQFLKTNFNMVILVISEEPKIFCFLKIKKSAKINCKDWANLHLKNGLILAVKTR